ncbi:MAG: hypothetical protein Q9163_003537 [Psora crenata]
MDLIQGIAVPEWERAEKTLKTAKLKAGIEDKKSKTLDFPIEGHKYAIKLRGSDTAFTCVDNTEMRLRAYSGGKTQSFRCTSYEGQMGFICEGAAGGKGRYLGYDRFETLSCQAHYQRGWEHIDAMSDSDSGYMLWMKKDSHFAPVSKVSADIVKMMATTSTFVNFIKLD